jgi:hypothetical protein
MIGTTGSRNWVQEASKGAGQWVSSPRHFVARGKFEFVKSDRRIRATEIGAYENQSGSASADLELAISDLLP